MVFKEEEIDRMAEEIEKKEVSGIPAPEAVMDFSPKEKKAFQKIGEVYKYLNQYFPEREEAIAYLLSSLFIKKAEESTAFNIMLMGAPGTAKSKLIKYFLECTNLNYFKHSASDSSTPEDLLGPYILEKLEKGIYERNIEYSLPSFSLAWISEIGLFPTTLYGTILNYLSDRSYPYINGQDKVGATDVILADLNEIDSEENNLHSMKMAALIDRFTVLSVPPLKDKQNFEKVLAQFVPKPNASIILEKEDIETMKAFIDRIIPKNKYIPIVDFNPIEGSSVEYPFSSFIFPLEQSLKSSGTILSLRKNDQFLRIFPYLSFCFSLNSIDFNEKNATEMIWKSIRVVGPEKIKRIYASFTASGFNEEEVLKQKEIISKSLELIVPSSSQRVFSETIQELQKTLERTNGSIKKAKKHIETLEIVLGKMKTNNFLFFVELFEPKVAYWEKQVKNKENLMMD